MNTCIFKAKTSLQLFIYCLPHENFLPKLWHVHTAFKMLQYHEISIWGFGWRSKVLRVPLDLVAVSVPEFRCQRPIASMQKARISRVQLIQNEVDDFFLCGIDSLTPQVEGILFFVGGVFCELPSCPHVDSSKHELWACHCTHMLYLNAISLSSLRRSSRWFFGQLGLPVFEHLQEHNLTASCRLNKNSIPA